MHIKFQNDEIVSILSDLPEIFSIEYAETKLLRSVSDEAGEWSRMLLHLAAGGEPSHNEQHCCGITWRQQRTPAWFGDTNVSTHRFGRWIRIKVKNQILVVAFLPCIYSDGLRPYIDHRFVIACSDIKIIPIVLLFTDQITGVAEGDDSREVVFQSQYVQK